MVDSFVVFTKIILYISIFLKKKVQKVPIECALYFGVTNNYFLHYFLNVVKCFQNIRLKLKFLAQNLNLWKWLSSAN